MQVPNATGLNATRMRITRAQTLTKGQLQPGLPYLVHFALTMGNFALFGGLVLFLNGGGTKYALEELRGQIGDACCKYKMLELYSKVVHVKLELGI
jgi:hypothetical protein